MSDSSDDDIPLAIYAKRMKVESDSVSISSEYTDSDNDPDYELPNTKQTSKCSTSLKKRAHFYKSNKKSYCGKRETTNHILNNTFDKEEIRDILKNMINRIVEK